jgi:hypothetical protein
LLAKLRALPTLDLESDAAVRLRALCLHALEHRPSPLAKAWTKVLEPVLAAAIVLVNLAWMIGWLEVVVRR